MFNRPSDNPFRTHTSSARIRGLRGRWEHYMVSPWTRDDQVRVQVADIAPQVPGQIVKLLVQDNQFVHKGDLLFVIDQDDYKVALDLAKADVASKVADLEVKKNENERRRKFDGPRRVDRRKANL
jgi:multidrug resistance efflux pump